MSKYRDFITELYFNGFTSAEDAPTFRTPENFDRYHEGSGWDAYRGGNDWENGNTGVAVYLNPEGYNKEMARIWFEVKFPDDLAEAVDSCVDYKSPAAQAVKKWGEKASKKWIRETINIRRATRKFHGEHDGYSRNWTERKTWKECFVLALQSEVMQPFVKKFGVDKTKWIGTKRENVNESSQSAKFWWMDSSGELIPVSMMKHADTGREILSQKFKVNAREEVDIYKEMFKRHFIRVSFIGMWDNFDLEIDYTKTIPPSGRQWKALKDLAIEIGASSIIDNTIKKEIRISESCLLAENFHGNKDWFIYEGNDTITTVFEDNTRQTFKLHYRKNKGADKDKWKTKAARTWKKLATEIRNSAGRSSGGNPIEIPWQQCFSKALQSEEMQEYINDLRATPIFEGRSWLPQQNIWLATDGTAQRVASHEKGASDILRSLGKPIDKGYRDIYEKMYRLGYARVIVGDNQYPLIIDTGKNATPRLSRPQKEWVEDKSFELGLNGEYSNAYGKSLTMEELYESVNEMTYDDLRSSMKNFRLRRGGNGQTAVVGDNGREERSKHVGVKPLRIISTVGKDRQNRETSLFSYKSEAAWGDPGARYQGYIRFLEGGDDSEVAPSFQQQSSGDVEVNCTCPDYRYVWAKPNAEKGAGTTSKDGSINEAAVFPQSGPVQSKGVAGYGQFKGGGNDNRPGLDKGIRNPANVPGLCKHLLALSEYLDNKTKDSPVAPVDGEKSASPVASDKPKKPVNIFETMRQFASANPQFTVQYED